ncbi:hypothetical protein BJX99DRAFT_254573 [Aspergillus californicus]
MAPVNRITLFKIPSPDDQQKLLNVYKTMKQDALKDGKPYILSCTAGPAYPDVRNQGFTVAVISQFESVEDMKFYDDECQAHAALKKVARSVHQGAMMVYFGNGLA